MVKECGLGKVGMGGQVPVAHGMETRRALDPCATVGAEQQALEVRKDGAN